MYSAKMHKLGAAPAHPHTHNHTAANFFSAEVGVGDMQHGHADHVHDSLLSSLPEADHLLR